MESEEKIKEKIKEFIKVMEKCKLSKVGTVWTSFHRIFSDEIKQLKK